MIEGEAHPAPSQKGIVLVDGKIGQGFVAADVQGAHDHRFGGERLQHPPVNLALFLLAGERFADHESEFGAIQTDPLGAAGAGGGDVGQQSRLGVQGDTVAIAGLGGQVAQFLQSGRQFGLGGDQLPVLGAQGRIGIDVHPAMIAVHNDLTAFEATERTVAQTHDRRDTHGPRQQGDVRQRRTPQADDGGQLALRRRRQVRHAHFLGHQDTALGWGIQRWGRRTRAQVVQYPPAQIAQILGAGAEIRVLGLLQQPNPGHDRVAPGGRRPAAGPDAGEGFADQAVAAQYHPVDGEQGLLGRRQQRRQAVAGLAQLPLDLGDGRSEPGFLGGGFGGRPIGNILEHGQQMGNGDRTDDHAWRTGHPLQGAGANDQRVEQFLGRAAQDGMVERAGQLRGDGDQKIHLVGLELADGRMLDRQHAQHAPVLDQGRSQKGMVIVLANLANRMKPQVARRVFQVQRFPAFGDQPDQPLSSIQPHPAHRLGVQASGRHEHVFAVVFVG